MKGENNRNHLIASALIGIISVICGLFVLAGCEQTVESKMDVDANNNMEPAIDEPLEDEGPEFTGVVSSVETGIIDKYTTRQFIADTDKPVTWTVTGGSEGGGTSISNSGLLSVGRSEYSITLRVRAESGGVELGTARVKVRGWQDLTEKLSGIFAESLSFNDDGIVAAAYGNGTWVIAGHSIEDWKLPAIAWSDNDGKSWHKAEFPQDFYENYGVSIVYGGPAGNERFVLGRHLGNAAYSTDGKKWTSTKQILKSYSGGHISPNNLGYMTYGETADGGFFITSNGTSEIAYSPDGVTWTTREEMKLNGLCYGTGIIDGNKVGIFMGDHNGNGSFSAYSTNGTEWMPLTANEAENIGFIPSMPNSSYRNIVVQALPVGVTGSDMHKMFTMKIFATDSGMRNPSDSGTYGPYPNAPGIYIYKSRGSSQFVRYDRCVKFVLRGGRNNSLYMAFGAGPRAAIAHAEAFE
jgi:hypothetical protein